MASLQHRLQIIIDAENKANGAFSAISKDLDKFKKNVESMQPTFQKMALAGTVAFTAIAGAVGMSIKSASEAEVAMAKFDTTLNNMVGTSLEVNTGLTKTVSTLKLTESQVEAVDIAIKEKTNSLGKLKKSYNEGKMTTEEYQLAVKKTKNEIAQLNEKLGEADISQIAITKTIKLTADEVSKARQQFIDASKAVVQLGFDDEDTAVGMSRFFQATGDATKAVELNALAMDLARAKNIDYNTAVGLVGQVLAGNGRVLKQYQIDIKDSATPLEALGILHDKVKGQAVAFANTTQGKMEALTVTFGNLKEAVGGAFLDSIGKVFEKITPVIQKMGEWAEKNPQLVKTITIVALALSGLVAVIGMIGLVIPYIITGFQVLITIGGLLATVMGAITLPILLIIAGIGALIAIGVLLYQHWDQVSAFAVQVWTNIANFFVSIGQTISETFMAVWNGIILFLQNTFYFIIGLVAMFMDMLIPGWQEYLKLLWEAWKLGWDMILTYLKAVWGGIQIVASAISTAFQIAWNAVVAVFNWAKDEIKKALDSITAFVKPLFDTLDKIINKIKDVGSAVGGVISKGVSKVVEKGKSVVGARAMGGPVSGGASYLVGENGPEYFTPATAGRISNGSGSQLIINISGNSFMGKEGVAKMLADQIVKELGLRSKLSY